GDNYSSECEEGFFVTHDATHEKMRIMPQAGQACDRGHAGNRDFLSIGSASLPQHRMSIADRNCRAFKSPSW
ncbi:hypothetical protein RA272_28230, partial [Pseudomonas syringae pv. tagetis]|uniref:hypothetical protein n=1 Tax=Pseudomonas syringae group genomosp. 7 TaxID=251699 RepID=UPI0037700C8D